jgi:hypothetical protein
MAPVRSAKAGHQRHGSGGYGRRSGGSSQAPLGVGRNEQQPNLLTEVSERQSLPRFSDLTLMAFLVVGAALPYLNTLRNGFVSDDENQVLHNPFIRTRRLSSPFQTRRTLSLPGPECGGDEGVSGGPEERSGEPRRSRGGTKTEFPCSSSMRLEVSAVCNGLLRESTSAVIGEILDFGPLRTRDCQRCRKAWPCAVMPESRARQST